MIFEEFRKLGEYAAAGLFENEERGLFYRKALGLCRYYENCALPEYTGKKLYPSGIVNETMSLRPHYLSGFRLFSDDLRQKAPELLKKYNEVFSRFRTSVPYEHSVAGNMYTHSIPNYPRFLKEGLLSYIPRIERIENEDIRDGLLILVEGIKNYISRCVSYLESVNADKTVIDTLKKVPLYPADNIYEAVFSWNFIMYLDNCDNLGCLARGLAPYFTGEDITELLKELFENLNENGGYSMSLDTSCPELTRQCLVASRGLRRPMIEFFAKENMPDCLWHEAFNTLRTSNGQPAFYNSDVLFSGLKERFPNITDEDVKCFCGGGCTESMITGFSNVGSLDAGINLLLILDEDIRRKLSGCNDFESFYGIFIEDVKNTVRHIQDCINKSRKCREETTPLPMRTLLIDDCIDNGKDYNAGGARYNWSIINFAAMINVIDSLLAIRTLVFDEKKYSAEELIEKLDADDDAFLSEARGLLLSFGRDQDEVNSFANDLSRKIFTTTKDGELYEGMGFLSASIQFNTQAAVGSYMGASPDGRKARSPLCDSLAAIMGKDSEGPTALLSSVSSLDLKDALGIPVLNFNVRKDFSDDVMKALILGYMEKGGIQMQITCASKEELLDAYEHPEYHNDLVVRVGGYSEYFNRLSDELKRMVIDRTIQNEASL